MTHWLVALKTAEASCGSLSGDAALSHPNALRLGAIFPDVLFYLTGSRGLSRYRDLAQAYHGAHGEDTYLLIRRIAALLPDSPYPVPLQAFLAGVACHIQTDMVFHPLVYYLCGNYDDADPVRRTRSVQDHRRLECLMDIYFCGGSKGFGAQSLKNILKNLELPLPYLLGALFRTSVSTDEHPAVVSVTKRALMNFQILQGLFGCKLPARLLDALTPFLSATGQEIAALFYSPALDAYLPRLRGVLTYQNPVTGIAETITLSDLLSRSVAGSAALIHRIEKAAFSNAPVLPEKGPSLIYGVAGDSVYLPRYFSEKPFFRTADSTR
jgi:hypothetical protein